MIIWSSVFLSSTSGFFSKTASLLVCSHTCREIAPSFGNRKQRQVDDCSALWDRSQMRTKNSEVYVLLMHTWQRLTWVRRFPAFNVVGTGFLEMRRFRISTTVAKTSFFPYVTLGINKSSVSFSYVNMSLSSMVASQKL